MVCMGCSLYLHADRKYNESGLAMRARYHSGGYAGESAVYNVPREWKPTEGYSDKEKEVKSRSDLDDGCERAIEIKRIVRLRGIWMPETGDRAMEAMMGS